MNDATTTRQADLREWLNILNRRKVPVVITVLLAVVGALAYSALAKPEYSARATVLIPQQQPSAALNIQNSQLGNANDLQRYVSDQQQFARSDLVHQLARKTLGYQAGVSVGTSLTADILTFTATDGTKSQAARIANAYAKAYIVATRQVQTDDYTQRITAIQGSIAQLKAKEAALKPGDPQLAGLQQSINTLTQTVEQTQAAMQLTPQGGPTIVSAATVPSRPSSPKPLLDGLIGLLIGILLSIAIAALTERFDDRIRSRESAERAGQGKPLVALLPLVDGWKDREGHHLALLENPTSPASEAYRTLRTSIQFMGMQRALTTIGITSSIPGEGKTTAAANLALAFARSGKRVAAISCDLRRPRLHNFFGLENEFGLTSLLLEEARLEDVLQNVPGEPLLTVVSSGPVPPNPAEILGLDRTKEVIQQLGEHAELVIVDCPPVLPVADALIASGFVDAVFVLAAARMTSIRDLRRTLELLDQVHAPVMGTVLNHVPTGQGMGYGYTGGYGYQSQYAPSGEKSAPTLRIAPDLAMQIAERVHSGRTSQDDSAPHRFLGDRPNK